MRRSIFAVLIGFLAASAPSFAQEAKPRRVIPFEGPEVFCHVLFHEGLTPISLKELGEHQQDTLVIVFGNPVRTRELKTKTGGGLGHFVAEGGNLLVVTDHEFHSTQLSLQISGHLVVEAEESAYGHRPECPWLPSATAGDHPIFLGLRKGIATNRPSSVRSANPNVEPLLPFPTIEPRYYMVGSPKDAPAEGRMLFIAGQGMFMNGMMLQSDNDNFEFAVNAIRWLREGPKGALRSKALLMVDGKVIGDFNMSLSPKAELPRVPLPPVQAVNRLIRGMEEERLPQKILNSAVGDHFDRLIGVLMALATFGLLLYAAKKFLEGRFHPETASPRLVGAAAPAGAGLKRGRERLLTLADQADTAQESCQLARAWLRAEFGMAAADWPAGAAVELRVQGGFWGLQRQADAVILSARGEASASRRQLTGLIAALPALSEARKAGRLTLLVDGKNVRHFDE